MSMERSVTPNGDFSGYIARTQELMPLKWTAPFLVHIPEAGYILDFGTGSGRWAAAFVRDRPDVVVDALDKHIDQAVNLGENWRGEKIQSLFQDFKPKHSYDGIWASAVLFFMHPQEMRTCFHTLVSALNAGGTIAFTMVDDCQTAKLQGYHGLSRDQILQMLQEEGLELNRIHFDEKAIYGKEKRVIPTYSIRARKPK